ncbi:NAD-dependent epimerase/dehydratase family protein [Xanthovirga aplysinae]|uniref:NAD-dependent epimerase/dehydratase family protein n=1 Tax=Xanthovirga aplysinae TaxID=2529853 RepID=UPI0012BCBD2F|nr:NAD-dependent epimerase/dehydratase family protein [Xanthovirga aplysinae]MTI32888.1 NAD-dependent epimerase/dehydratase family protein [Xanthovirga aplysinae]
MKRSLVTGGAGFIGTHVVNHLLKMDHEVVVLDDLSGGFRSNVPKEAIFVEDSIIDARLVSKLFTRYQFDYVYHLAAYAAEGLSHFIRNFNYQNNLIGSVNLINESVKHNIKCFVFTSSIAVYGTNTLPMREAITPQPEDPYGIAKYAIELDLKSAHDMFGLNHIIFRPHNVYGTFQNIGDRYRNVIGIFMNQLLQNKPLTIFGDGKQTRAFSYIDDVAPYIAQSVQTDSAYNQVFNIGGDQQYTIEELAIATMEAMSKEGRLQYVEARNEVMHAYADHSKIKEVFNLQEETFTPLNTGLAQMAEWVKKVGSRKTSRFDSIEITEKLPEVWFQED